MKVHSKLMFGFALLAIGLFIGLWTWNTIESFQSATRRVLFIDYLEIPASERFYYPTHYWIMRVPDYLLRYLELGVFITTTSLTIIASSLLKQLTGIFGDTEMKQLTKLIVGFSVLALGLIIRVEVGNALQSFQVGVRQIDDISVGPGYPFWLPLSWEVLKVPDYLLRYLVLGVFTTTIGITFFVSPLWKRLADYIEDD